MNLLIPLFSAGLAQALFLLCGLSLLKVRSSMARWLLVALTSIFTLMLAEELLDVAGYPLRIGLGLAIEFALGPLLYFFVRALFGGERVTLRQMAPHAMPLVAASLLLAWLNLAFDAEGVSLSHPDMRGTVATMVLVKILVFFTYAGAALSVELPLHAGERRLKVWRKLRLLIAIMAGAYFLQAIGFVLFLMKVPGIPDSDAIGGLVLAASLYLIGYFCFLNRHIFDLRDTYEGATLATIDATAIREQALNHLIETEAFRNPELDLRLLARALLLSPGRLSQALNAGTGGGFATMVNACRLNAFHVARADPANKRKTVLELAYCAGFNSKATFYRALRTALPETAATRPNKRLTS